MIFSPGMVLPLFGEVKPVTSGVGLTGSKAAAVHAKVTTGNVTSDCRLTRADDVPEQMVCGLAGFTGNRTAGLGFTVRMYGGVAGLPHPLAVGTTAKLTVDGTVPEFTNVSAMSPVPLKVAGVMPGPPVAFQK